MIMLKDIKSGSKLRGLSNDLVCTVISAEWFGEQAVKVVFEDTNGTVSDRVVFQDDCAAMELISDGQFWTFGAKGSKKSF